jgi:hypothetical protein
MSVWPGDITKRGVKPRNRSLNYQKAENLVIETIDIKKKIAKLKDHLTSEEFLALSICLGAWSPDERYSLTWATKILRVRIGAHITALALLDVFEAASSKDTGHIADYFVQKPPREIHAQTDSTDGVRSLMEVIAENNKQRGLPSERIDFSKHDAEFLTSTGAPSMRPTNGNGSNGNGTMKH